MSDATSRRLKVSREGIVLIKSLEGFRPRAVRDGDGRWLLGYGHTASAREGLTVSEPDAELLLQYDLLPVVKALNEQVSAPLNQHQFDALASFAISVGVARFLGSDVLQRLNGGHVGDAADALFGWPETTPPDARLRRRAAERALFVTDPGSPMNLAELLVAPLPPPVAETAAAPAAEAPANARAAAVAALLGETPSVPAGPAHPATPAAAQLAGPFGPGPSEAPDSLTASHLQRYSPYAAPMIGPLPGFPVDAGRPEPEPATEADFAQPGPPGQSAGTPDGDEAPFDGTPTEPVMRHEVEASPSRRFEWGVKGAYAIMGLAGLAACAASAAAFRLAMADDSPLNDYTVITLVLAVIGVVCVGVSTWNLFARWGRRD